MKYIILYNFDSANPPGQYVVATIPLKRADEKLPQDYFKEVILAPENNFYLPLALWASKEINQTEISEEKDVGKIYVRTGTNPKIMIVTCCKTQEELYTRNNIAFKMLNKYAGMSPNPELKRLAKGMSMLEPIEDNKIPEIDNEFIQFFSGVEKHGYTCSLVA